MRTVLDLHMLAGQLKQADEREPHFDEELNPYLFETVLPMLEQGKVTLSQIALNEFDSEDPLTILRYYDWKNDLFREMFSLNNRICEIPPVCTKARAFL